MNCLPKSADFSPFFVEKTKITPAAEIIGLKEKAHLFDFSIYFSAQTAPFIVIIIHFCFLCHSFFNKRAIFFSTHMISIDEAFVKPKRKESPFMQYYKHPSRRPITYPMSASDIPTASPVFDKSPTFDNVSDTSSSNLPPLSDLSLGMAYVPYQRFEDLNEPTKALECGTLFRALYMPFYGQKRRG